MESPHDQLKSRIFNRTAVVAVVGIGYVGLPLAVAFAVKGFRVIGIDTSQKRVDSIQRGESYVEDVSDDQLKALPDLKATTQQSALVEADIVLICVPTPLTKTKDPDLTYIVQEATEIAKYLHKGQIIVLESTTYPGTTRDVVLPLLQATGLQLGEDYFLAYSPEMIDPGNEKFGLHNTPKIVSGADDKSRELAELVYQQVAGTVIPVSSLETAEMVKVFSNVFRSVNIALVNEMAQLCESMKVSIWEVVYTAAKKPFGYMPFFPGPGIGGHCLPTDPYYLSCKAREHDFHVRFIELAAQVNENMPYYVVEGVEKALNAKGKALKGSRILVLGMAYKKDTSDSRESPSIKLVELLYKEWAEVHYHDPFVSEMQFSFGKLQSECNLPQGLQESDCVVLAVDHSDYVRDRKHIASGSQLIYDAKGIMYGIKSDNIVRLGE